ncbi:MAG: 2-C-methyl-D-erythritol 4-phosphate cytidylyltransferase [Sulfuricaulis sp.]
MDRIWALVPAGGQGLRMQAALPKQYLPLLGRPVIWHSLERLGAHPRIHGVLVGISRQDNSWQTLAAEIERLPKFRGKYTGGDTRARTVLNGLQELLKHAQLDDWVLVHDAVRPCVRRMDIDKLISTVASGEQGGLLAFSISDTVKRVDYDGRVLETVNRTGLWRAATPQMFRIKSLIQALERAMGNGIEITDEASAIEAAGGHPRVVACHLDNIKITLPEDIALAELYMKQQQGQA